MTLYRVRLMYILGSIILHSQNLEINNETRLKSLKRQKALTDLMFRVRLLQLQLKTFLRQPRPQQMTFLRLSQPRQMTFLRLSQPR